MLGAQANCLAEVLFDQALQRANELDGYLLRFGRTVGPLHGLPISVKEHIYLKGTTATSGLVAWADNMCDDDALIISQLKDAGAVFHVKTTNPQALMSLETRSNLFGRALNPYNTNLTSGGSSGGEAALLAMHGASMGIGTDIGGSIRVPSAFCGIVGFKPSVGRTPHGGLSGLHQGMKNIIGVVGPMARCLEDVELFMAAAIANDPALKEPGMIEKAWTGASSNAAIRRVAIMWDDGMVHPHPPITQALQRVRTALQKPGIEVVDWQADLHEPIFHLVTQLYFQDGGEEYHQVLRQGNESAVPLLEKLLGACGPALTVKQSWKLSLFSPLVSASSRANERNRSMPSSTVSEPCTLSDGTTPALTVSFAQLLRPWPATMTKPFTGAIAVSGMLWTILPSSCRSGSSERRMPLSAR